MSDPRTLNWPTYQTAPEDSIFALGVVSINYARFERAVTWVFAAVSGLTENHATMIMAKSNAVDRMQLIAQMVANSGWSDEATNLVSHFVDATDVLVRNRNCLVHSNIIHGTHDRAAIYRTSRQGNTILFEATVDQIRQVADDLNDYFYFGMALANCIAVKIHRADLLAGTVVFHEWPDKPPLPASLG